MSWIFFASSQKRPLLARSPLNLIAAALIIYTFISLLFGNNYLTGNYSFHLYDWRFKDWKNFCLMPLLFFITLNLITDRVWIVRILLAMACAIILMEYYTIHQIHDYSALVSREKITGTFQFLGPNEVAAFFNECTIIVMGIFFCLKQKKIKWPLLGIIYVNIFCIIFLYSRGSYLGTLAGMAFLFFFKNKKLLLPLFLIAILWQSVLPEKAIQRIKGTTNEFGQLDESSERRILIWKIGIELFDKNPITGIGYGVFRYLGFDLGDTHNIYVKILVEQGLIGISIFLAVISCFLRMGYILYKKGEDGLAQGMGLGLTACSITVIVNNLFGDRWAYFELSAYLWIFLGLVARLTLMSQNAPVSPQSQAITQAKTIDPPKIIKKTRYYDLP
ncbi:MAG: O-antigen ligase family protein [Candidatus Omnitrophica bacterium]|nr:O-antigen ligase family protein [Candidatus Omnitrophota bacterium]